MAVAAEKVFKGNTVLRKFYDVCPNQDPPALHGYEKKFRPKFRVKTKKRKDFTSILSLISDIFVPKK